MRTLLAALLLAGLRPLAAQCSPVTFDTVFVDRGEEIRLRADAARLFGGIQVIKEDSADPGLDLGPLDEGTPLQLYIWFERVPGLRLRFRPAFTDLWVRKDGLWRAMRLDTLFYSGSSLGLDSSQVRARGWSGPRWPPGALITILVAWQDARGRQQCTALQRQIKAVE